MAANSRFSHLARVMARRAFEGRKGQLGGPCTRRVLTEDQLRDLLLDGMMGAAKAWARTLTVREAAELLDDTLGSGDDPVTLGDRETTPREIAYGTVTCEDVGFEDDGELWYRLAKDLSLEFCGIRGPVRGSLADMVADRMELV